MVIICRRLLLMAFMAMAAAALPPLIQSSTGHCPQPNPPTPFHQKPPPTWKPSEIVPPQVTGGPPTTAPPARNIPPFSPAPTCPIDGLKLGLCLDVVGGPVHVGQGDPVVHVCCPVLKGLLEVEEVVCPCTAIRPKVLNLNVFVPLALQVLAICRKKPPQGFVCPPVYV